MTATDDKKPAGKQYNIHDRTHFPGDRTFKSGDGLYLWEDTRAEINVCRYCPYERRVLMISSQAAALISCLVTALAALVIALVFDNTMVRFVCVGVTFEAAINSVVLVAVEQRNKSKESPNDQ